MVDLGVVVVWGIWRFSVRCRLCHMVHSAAAIKISTGGSGSVGGPFIAAGGGVVLVGGGGGGSIRRLLSAVIVSAEIGIVLLCKVKFSGSKS
jgi:hypothetical protein